MDFFELPSRTNVGRVIPKNAFDEYTNTKEKRLFIDLVKRITWTHKLSSDTVNLDTKDIQEIQIFKIELKEQSEVLKILNIIDKAIPYHIIFWVTFKDEAYVSASSKHPHPVKEGTSVIDWTFASDWYSISSIPYAIKLVGSLDAVFKNLCVQLTGQPDLSKKSMSQIVNKQVEVDSLMKEIKKLKLKMAKSQFNKKVELNLELIEKQKLLRQLKAPSD
jgi:hypothetical protein